MEDSLARSDKELGDEGGATVMCRRERLTLDVAWCGKEMMQGQSSRI